MTSVGTSLPDDHDETKSIRPATLIQLHKLGFKPVPLSLNHKPIVDWTPIYENPEYWSDEKLIAECPKFPNVATAFGKTYVKDLEGRDLYLNGFDCDSEPVYKIITTPFDEISNPQLKSKLLDLYSKYGKQQATPKASLLDFLKEITVVVKTRKPCGYLILWHNHTQLPHILTEDCKPGYEFEIKTDKSRGLATLPPSTHRDDQTKTFRYSYIGQTDKIGAINELYDIIIELLKECLVSDPAKVNGNSNDNCNDDNRSKDKRQANATSLYDLSEQMIRTTVAYFTSYYVVGRRHDFALCFSGATWYAKISEDSAGKIVSQLATDTNDEEIESRLTTLHETYEKANIGEPITGGPTLADLISAIKGCELEEAHDIMDHIQSFWRSDIQRQQKRKRKQENDRGSKLISVSEAIRLTEEGPANVPGKIVGMNAVQHMIYQIDIQCRECSDTLLTSNHRSKPLWRSSIKNYSKYYCSRCDREIATNIDYEYIPSLEIQVQDLEKSDNIEQLTAIVFGQHTEGIQFNDIVSLKGNLHVVRKYDNPRNRLQPILFVESIEKQSKDEEIKNTEEDIQEFKQFALKFREDDNEEKDASIIDELVSMTAPSTIGNELAKKALLIVAVNAGLPNDPTRLPKRIRSHVGLIGDPGQAKTQLLHQIAELVPGSRVESMQSSTPVSMTVYIDKEENGQRTYRPGPVVLSSGAILGLNEFGQMKNIEDDKYFTDAAEEGSFTVTKHGLNFRQTAHPSFVWTANPISGRWKNPDVIDEAEFPVIAQWGDRMDFTIPFIENTEETWIREYTRQRQELVSRLGSFASSTLWLKKYLIYARSLKPDIPHSVRTTLGNYLVEIAKQGVRGLPRKLEALERTAIGFAKLKLKEVVDEEDASDTIDVFNEMLKFYKQEAESLRDITFLQCLTVLQKTSPQEWKYDDLIQEIRSKNPNIDLYLAEFKKSRNSSKMRAVKSLLDKHPNVRRVNENPTRYVWLDKDDRIQSDDKRDEDEDQQRRERRRNHLEQSRVARAACDGQKRNGELENTRYSDRSSAIRTVSSEIPGISADAYHDAGLEKMASHTSHAAHDSSGIIDYDRNIDKISLRHSSAELVLTNDDREDVESDSGSGSSIGTGSGGSNSSGDGD